MSGAGRLGQALIGRRWWWVTLLVIALMLLLARLGFWQLDRLDQRRTANAELRAALESAPIDLNSAFVSYADLEPDAVPSELANRDISMTGHFDYSSQRILKLQNWQGFPGVHLITAFVLEDSGRAVLVDRGWIPDSEYVAGNTFEERSGSQTIEGYISLTETLARKPAGSAALPEQGSEVFRVDVAALQSEMPHELAPFYVMQAPLTNDQDSLPIRIPKTVDLSEGPHLGYAVQWFIFSLGLGAGYLVYVHRWLGKQPAEPPRRMSAHQN